MLNANFRILKRDTRRIVPITKVLLNSLKILKEEVSKEYEFNDDYFVIGDAFPVASNTITSRKNRNCELASVPQLGSMTLDIPVHLFWLIMVLI